MNNLKINNSENIIGDPEISSRKMRDSIIYFCVFIGILYIYNYDNKHVLCESKTKVKPDI